MNKKRLLLRVVLSVEGDLMWSEFRDMRMFVRVKKSLKLLIKKLLRKIMGLRRILSGKSNMRNL
jgi:hypothetical protein